MGSELHEVTSEEPEAGGSIDCTDPVMPSSLRSKWEDVGSVTVASAVTAKIKPKSRFKLVDLALLVFLACSLALMAAFMQFSPQSLNMMTVSCDVVTPEMTRAAYVAACGQDPKFTPLLISWAEKQERSKNYAQACNFLSLALSIQADNGCYYFKRSLDEFYATNNVEVSSVWGSSQAMDDINSAIRHASRISASYNNRGCLFYRRKEFSHAIEDFSKAIKLAPDRPEYLLNRGKAYLIQEMFEPAIDDFIKAAKCGDAHREFVSLADRRRAWALVSGCEKLARGTRVANGYALRTLTYAVPVDVAPLRKDGYRPGKSDVGDAPNGDFGQLESDSSNMHFAKVMFYDEQGSPVMVPSFDTIYR